MRVGIPRERASRERRVASVPATVKTMVGWGWDVVVEHGAGEAAGFFDDQYVEAGAAIVDSPDAAHQADLVARVGPPTVEEIGLVPAGAVLLGFLEPFTNRPVVEALVERQVTGVAFEAVPRITIAQSMDALSSQATVAGYAAVLTAAYEAPKFLPMLTTAAGTIPPARAVVLGVGVAGLQAIATLRRLGAVVYAYDIRPETKEQVQSLGGRFIEAPQVEGDESGYAREVEEDIQRRQWETLAPHIAGADVVVTTAQIPGRPAPLLVTDEMVASMRPGAVIVDMATKTGGNVAPSRPDETVVVGGVRIYGPTDLASRVEADASRMYARNVQAMVERMRTEDGIAIDLDDAVIGPSVVTHQGQVVHPRSRQFLGLEVTA